MAKAKAPKRKVNGYKMPDAIPKGEVLQDLFKKQWRLGASIGKGGFGEIYSAQEVDAKGNSYPYVVKIEPHENGPLFVEMHFYSRNGKKADVDAFKAEKKLKSFGMPVFIGSGSHEFKGQKYRFVVMEKFGSDIWKLYLSNNKKFPAVTVYKLGLQVVDVLEYIHSKGYVHADIKGANILLGEKDKNQAYLVDFGLAGRFTSDTVFKPNPKKMHDGTIEYLSRDAHQGVQTRRGDLEILAYNLIHWLGGPLPWEKNLTNPKTVEESKIKHMSDIPMFMKTCFKNATAPDGIVKFLKYINSMEFNESPNYEKVRQILRAELKLQGGTESSPLQFKSAQKRKSDILSPAKKTRGKKAPEPSDDDEFKENISDPEEPSEDEDTPRKRRNDRRNKISSENVEVKKTRARKPKVNNDDDVEEDEVEKKTPVKKVVRRKLANGDVPKKNKRLEPAVERVVETKEMKRIKELLASKSKSKTVGRKKVVESVSDDGDEDDDVIPDSGDEEEVVPVSRRARR